MEQHLVQYVGDTRYASVSEQALDAARREVMGSRHVRGRRRHQCLIELDEMSLETIKSGRSALIARHLVAAVALLAAGVTAAQSYALRPVRILTGTPGSGSDVVARLIAPGVSASLGQAMIVDNRPGIIAVETAAKAPDGHTILIYGSVVWIEPLLRDGVAWDPVKDFAPITLAASSPNLLLVNPLVPAHTVNDLVALARAKPGTLSYASSGSGTTAQLAAELFKSMAGGLNIVHVPYKGAGPAFVDLISGQVQLFFVVAASAMQHVKAGRLKALAVTSAQPSIFTPGLPTVAASGLPGYESVLMVGAFAPARTSPAIIKWLNQEMVHVLNRADVKEKLFNTGAETVGSSPEQLTAAIKADMTKWEKVIRDAGIRAK